MRKIAQIMGMPITIDIPNISVDKIFDLAFARLRQIDERFSTYKSGSEVSRYNRRELDEVKVSSELKEVLRACRDWQKKTDGYFSPFYKDQLDTDGYVKGWAIAKTAKVIQEAGFGTFCLSAGGDILTRSNSDKVWSIGIQDPSDKDRIIKTLKITNGAVATSGAYERGAHIINPKTGQPANYWASVTIAGPDIITTDVLATACFAAGKEAQDIMKKFKDYDLLGIKA